MSLRALESEIKADKVIGDAVLESLKYDREDLFAEFGIWDLSLRGPYFDLRAKEAKDKEIEESVEATKKAYIERIEKAKKSDLEKLEERYTPLLGSAQEKIGNIKQIVDKRNRDFPERKTFTEKDYESKIEKTEANIRKYSALIVKTRADMNKRLVKDADLSEEQLEYATEIEDDIKKYEMEIMEEAEEAGQLVEPIPQVVLSEKMKELMEKFGLRKRIIDQFNRILRGYQARVKFYNTGKNALTARRDREISELESDLEEFSSRSNRRIEELRSHRTNVEEEYKMAVEELKELAKSLEADVSERAETYHRRTLITRYIESRKRKEAETRKPEVELMETRILEEEPGFLEMIKKPESVVRSYINTKGREYWLHSVEGKYGATLYHFSKKPEGAIDLGELPEYLEIFENKRNLVPMVRKKK